MNTNGKSLIISLLTLLITLTATAQKKETGIYFHPSHYKIQYCGGMGLISAGCGWEYGRKERWETDIMAGIVPQYDTRRPKFCLTIKQNLSPWHIPWKDKLIVEPLTAGLYINTIFDEEYWGHQPKRYPNNYYGFSTRLRIFICIGQRLSYKYDTPLLGIFRTAGIFYEISSCDTYIVSRAVNTTLRPKDYLRLSLGLKLGI